MKSVCLMVAMRVLSYLSINSRVSDILLSCLLPSMGDAMPELVVIPTQYKTKLPHSLSYPLGAEALSTAFADVPQFNDLKVRFWFYAKKNCTTSAVYRVLEIRYFRGSMNLTTGKSAFDLGWLERNWEITVESVPRNRRHFIKGLLEREALPLARTWLIESGDREEVGGLTLTFNFDEEQEILKVERDSRLSPKQA